MRVLVTGGRGFVGSYVHKEFESKGHEVISLSNLSHPSKLSEGREYIYGDVRYQWDIEQAVIGVDCVIHLAARINVDRSRQNPRPFFDGNVLGTFNVLEACRKHKVKMIHASTSEALGSMQLNWCCGGDPLHPEGTGMNEEHPYSPDNPYGATKAAADMLCIGWYKSFGVDVTLLRSFNITGKGQAHDKEGGFIPKVIESIIKNENPIIFGAGNQTRDYVWVGDVARAYYLLATGDYAGSVFHVGTGREISIDYIASKLIEISGKNLEINYVTARPQELRRLKCDASKIKALGWKVSKEIEIVLVEMWEDRLMQEVGVTDIENETKRIVNARIKRK